jgi:ABC transporter substrate binding protein
VYRIALVRNVATMADTSEHGDIPFYQAMFAELRRLGYVEGQDLVVERYSSGNQAERFAKVAGEVVTSAPDLVFVSGGRSLLLALKAATTTIPMVVATSEAVRSGVVASLAKPGGNITGISVDAGAEIWGKRLELLREAVPKLSRVGFLGTQLSWEAPALTPLREAARKVGIPLVSLLLYGLTDEAEEYRRLFGTIAREGLDGLIGPLRQKALRTDDSSWSWRRRPECRQSIHIVCMSTSVGSLRMRSTSLSSAAALPTPSTRFSEA